MVSKIMKTKIFHERITCPKTVAPRLTSSCTEKLATVLLFLTLPVLAQAQFSYEVTNGSITLTLYTGSGGAVTIPSEINNLPVTSIGTAAFYKCYSLTDVTIPDSITTIGNE